MTFDPREFEQQAHKELYSIPERSVMHIQPTDEDLYNAGMKETEFDPKIYDKVFCRLNNIPYTLEEQLQYIFGE